MEEVELVSHRAIVDIPENAVEATIIAKVYQDGQIMEVKRDYGISDIREIFRKADEGYIDDDDRFVLTDKGMAYLEELDKRHG